MVCSLESARMAASKRLQAVGNASQTVTAEVCFQKLGGQYIRKELHEADEANLLDEEDMHIFGLRPMVDPLDLVCCKACKKPIKTSQYNAHAELCKSLSFRGEMIPVLDGPALKKKPPRKQRKKLSTVDTNPATSLGEIKKFNVVDSDHIDSLVVGQNHVTSLADSFMGNVPLNGPRIGPYNVEHPENVTIHSSKSFKRMYPDPNMSIQVDKCLYFLDQLNSSHLGPLENEVGNEKKVSENPPNTVSESSRTTIAKVTPYVPAPLATKIYYSQRNHHLRRAICHMFNEEQSKDSSKEASPLEVVKVNAVPAQTSSPSNLNQVGSVTQQFLQLTQTPNQIHAARSESYFGKSGRIVLPMNTASELPVNNTLGPHTMSRTLQAKQEIV